MIAEMGLEMTNCKLVVLSVCASTFTQRWTVMKLKTKCMFKPNMNDKKWWQPRFQHHLVTKSRGTR